MLSLLASIYGKVADLRNRLYDSGVFESFDLGAPTISIGNITAGGTGKTPLVAHVAKCLAAGGQKVCILTRGYGRKDAKNRVLVSDGEQILASPAEAGDEPLELAQKLIGKAIVIADADRVSAADWAKRKFGATAFVLDDAFQHRKVRRDLDIVCIDATDPFGGGKMLPAGRLREPLSNLNRTDMVVITRANLAKDISDLRFEISELNAAAAIFTAKNDLKNVARLEEFLAKIQRTQREVKDITRALPLAETAPKSTSTVAFCGLGNHENFFEQLRREKFSVAAGKTFRDHHIYTQKDVIEIEAIAREKGAEMLITTAKDAVKLSDLKFEIPCFVAEIEMIISDADAFEALLHRFFVGGAFLSPQ
jgi:tetraacyldisaccharide 4'-kinase